MTNAGSSLGMMYLGDTLVNSLGGKTYSNYVIPAAIPEPNSVIVLCGAWALGITRRRRKVA